jgi:hypothetical protein
MLYAGGIDYDLMLVQIFPVSEVDEISGPYRLWKGKA